MWLAAWKTNGQRYTMLTVTSSTLVKNLVSNNEMTSSIVISRRLAEVSCVGLKGFWPASTGNATPMVIHTEQQASGSHFRSIIEVTGIELFESKMNCEKYGKAEDVLKAEIDANPENR
jgi:hypothetical protein